jgi:retron-type reverse transcriptase
MDFKKAFDTVDHGTLIKILDNLGIGDPLLSWLASYLNSRRQFVSINGVLSDLCIIPSGVPQGGHLSPLLFILFVNSLPDFLSFATIPQNFISFRLPPPSI